MFDHFFKKRSTLERHPDQVWFSQAAKWRSLVAQAQTPTPEIWRLFIAHFPYTLTEFQARLEDVGLGVTNTRLPQSEGPVGLALARTLPATFNLTRMEPPQTAQLIVVEHYPLPEPDQALITLAESWPGPAQLTFHTSLDDPLLQRFGGERVRLLFHQLELAETMPIGSPLVNQTIAGAQKKLARRVPVEQRADSAAQWFNINLPG